MTEEAADGNIADQASRLAGFTISTRQVRRMRQRGLLPALVRRGRGKGQGWRWEPPEETTEHAAYLARAVRENRSLDEAALIGFARRDPVGTRAYRNAHAGAVRRLRRGMERIAGSRDPSAIAGALGYYLSRRSSRFPTAQAMRDRLGEVGECHRLGDVVESVAAVAFAVGNTLAPPSLVAAAGWELHRGLVELTGERDPLAALESDDVAGLSLQALSDCVKMADDLDLVRARDVLLILLEVARGLARRGGVIGRLAGGVAQAGLSDDLARALVLIPGLLLIVRIAAEHSPEMRFEELWADLRDLPDKAFEPKRAARVILSEEWRPVWRAALQGGSGTSE